jgi:phosphotransferase system enzyme I (PtsI)
VFEAQALLLDDPALVGPLETAVRETGLSAAAAVESAFEEAAHELEALDDPYLSGRAADVRDVKTRLLYLLEGKEERTLADAGESAVIIARDLTPSDTASLEPGQVRGIILAEGTPTAHATILARGLGLPLVIGAGAQAWEIEQGQDVLLDGDEGTVLIEPDEQERKRYHLHAASVSAGGLTTSDGSTFLTTTADGRRIVLLANASTPAEAALAAERGAEGIGLLRTEFLLAALTRDRSEAPNERDLAAAYGAVFEHILGKPVIVRVMDAGGDKPLPFLGFGQEANPFLGWRGIRILLDRPELFADQVRAVLRAAAEHGIDLRLMFPMISSVEEFLRARQMVETVVKEGDFPLAHPLEIGAMIEVPAAALIAEDLAREADFFSIGTNDLVQYTLACDRGNPRVSGLCDVSHPAVLRLIDMTVSAAHSAGKLVGVCGEAAGDPESIPLLLELGVDELSVGPARLAEVRRSVQTLRVGEPARSS